ncbi:MAG TPA: DUF1573 domain-containing protein, partial [Lacunisphaera sp.]
MKPHFPTLTLSIALCGAISAPALDWKTTQQIVKAAPLQSTAETAYEFTNRGDKAVTILSVDTSCDCLDAEPSVKVIAPGDTGRIRVRFTIADRSGVFQRLIVVTTDDAKEPAVLTAELNIPEIATLSPRSLEWPLHGPVDPKVVEITIAEGLDLTLGEVRPTSEAFTARLETLEAGRRYRLHLTPRSTAEAVNTAVRIHATTPTGRALIFSAYGNVR